MDPPVWRCGFWVDRLPHFSIMSAVFAWGAWGVLVQFAFLTSYSHRGFSPVSTRDPQYRTVSTVPSPQPGCPAGDPVSAAQQFYGPPKTVTDHGVPIC